METTKTYHVTIYRNNIPASLVNSVGIGLNREQADRITHDLNTALALLGVAAFARVIEEE